MTYFSFSKRKLVEQFVLIQFGLKKWTDIICVSNARSRIHLVLELFYSHSPYKFWLIFIQRMALYVQIYDWSPSHL